ncbi:unnamed protein product [Closterium sp. NIES-65]|nr:unnamed protein product [Closterium sp. NIES-65]
MLAVARSFSFLLLSLLSFLSLLSLLYLLPLVLLPSHPLYGCRCCRCCSRRPPLFPCASARLRVYLQSPGVIGDPYRPLPPMPFLTSWFTKAGWKRRWVKWSDVLKTGYTIAMLRRHNRGYSRHGLYRELAGTYKQINRAIAADDRTALRHLVTESAFTSLKSSLKHRAESGIARVDWHLVGTSEGNSKAVVPSSNKPPLSFKTLQARLISLEKSKPENGFVQLTLEIKSKQRIAAYDKRKKLISGDPDAEVDVKDIWVFERHMLHPELPWRLCGQLVAPPPQTDKSGKQNQAAASSGRR